MIDTDTPYLRNMAKTGIHIEPCKIGIAEQHNRRDPEYLKRLDESGRKYYDIFRDKTKHNLTWTNPEYQGRTLADIFEEQQRLVKERTGRAMQAKATPIREGVCPTLPTTTIEDFAPLIKWYQQRGGKVISIDIHNDEGHIDATTGERKYNRHAHIIFDFINHETGRSIKFTKNELDELQTVVAAALKMQRGKRKSETGAKHLKAAEYREKKAAEAAEAAKNQTREESQKASKILIDTYMDLLDTGEKFVTIFDNFQSSGVFAYQKDSQEKRYRDELYQKTLFDEYSVFDWDKSRLKYETAYLTELILRVQDAVLVAWNRIKTLAQDILAKNGSEMAKFASLEQQRDNYRLRAENAEERAENAEKRAESAEEDAEYWNKAHDEVVGEARSRLKNCASIIVDSVSDWNSIEKLENYGFAEWVGESFWEEAKKARARKESKQMQQQQKPKGPRRGF